MKRAWRARRRARPPKMSSLQAWYSAVVPVAPACAVAVSERLSSVGAVEVGGVVECGVVPELLCSAFVPVTPACAVTNQNKTKKSKSKTKQNIVK